MNILSIEQVKTLLKVLNDLEDKETANLVKLLLFSGIRRGEAFKLTWDDVGEPDYTIEQNGHRDIRRSVAM